MTDSNNCDQNIYYDSSKHMIIKSNTYIIEKNLHDNSESTF